MALIRLIKEAPWPFVELPSGLVVSKNKFEEQGEHSIRSIAQWVEEYKEPEEEKEPEPEPKPNYDSMTKIDLRLLCKERKVAYTDEMRKEALVELLKTDDENK